MKKNFLIFSFLLLFSSVEVFAQPITAVISATPTICSIKGSTASITVTTSATSPSYAWYYKNTPNSSWVRINATGVYSNYKTATLGITKTSVSPYSGTTYKVDVTPLGSSIITSNEAVLTVTTAPNAGTISGTQAICSNGPTTFTSNGDLLGTWTSSVTAKATIIASTGVITPVSAGTSTITYTITGSGGCANATATRTVTVTAAPNAGTVSGTQAICSNGTTTFTSNGSSGGVWTSSLTDKATINPSSGLVTGVTAGTSDITYTVTGTGGCANDTATRTVNVTAPLNPGTLTGIQAICSGGTTTIISDGDSGGTWASSNTAKATITSSGVVDGVAAGTSDITYTVGLGGCNTTATRTVTVTAPLNPGTVSGTQDICSNETTTFTSNGVSGGIWTSSNTAKATINPSSGIVNGVADGTSDITYTVGLGGCNTSATLVVINIKPAPSAGVISGAPTISSNEKTTYTSNGDSLGTWTSSAPGIATIGALTGNVDGVATGNTTITYTVEGSGSGSSCTAIATKTVKVEDSFVTTWEIANIDGTILSLPAQPGAGNYTINWGDGPDENFTAEDTPSHTYNKDGSETLTQRNVSFKGQINHLKFTDQTNLIAVQDWGTQKWTSMAYMFQGCTSLIEFPSSSPDLSLCTDMSGMFANATQFNQPLNSWNVSKVTKMYYMFFNATAFNQPLDLWDVSKVTNMYSMFENATEFEQPLGTWDIRSVTNMSNMFYNVTLEKNNYDNLLTGWTTLTPDSNKKPKNGVVFSGGNSNYENGASGHDKLTDTYNWVITDGRFIAPTTINISVCSGSAAVDLTATPYNSAYPLKWYSTATGGVVLGATPSTLTKSSTKYNVKSFWVSQMRTATQESARALITVTTNSLPTYISKTLLLTDGETTINNIGAYIGTNKILKLTAEQIVNNTYKWDLPENSIRTNESGVEIPNNLISSEEYIYINFPQKDNTPTKDPFCKVAYINESGCTSASSKTLQLIRTVPSPLTKLTITDELVEVLNFGPYLGKNKEFTLTAGYITTPKKGLQATSFKWVLPEGVTASGNAIQVTTGVYTSIEPSITINLKDADNQSPAKLTIGAYAKNGFGNSTVKTISLPLLLPTTPSTLKLTADDPTLAITNISTYFKADKNLTLTAAYNTIPATGSEATSYKWTLPEGVTASGNATLVSTGIYTSLLPSITVNFKDAVVNVKGLIQVSVNAVNNFRNSTSKTLSFILSLPKSVSTVSGSLTVCNRPDGFNYTITPPAFATEYSITSPIGSIVTSKNYPSNTTNELTTSELNFTIVYLDPVLVNTKLILTVDSSNGFGNSPKAKNLNITKTPNCSTPTTRLAVVTTKAFDKNNITLYPNPTASILNIKVGANHTKQTYTIANALGKIVLEGKLNKDNTPINVEHLSKGIYFIRLDNNNTSTFIKK